MVEKLVPEGGVISSGNASERKDQEWKPDLVSEPVGLLLQEGLQLPEASQGQAF